MKNRLLRSYLQYDWWKIGGVVLGGVLLLGFLFQSKDTLKDNEILDIFVTGEVRDSSFQEDMFSMVKNDTIHAIHTTAYRQEDTQYNQIANSFLSSVSDLYFLPESLLSTHKEYASYSKILDEEIQKKITDIDPSYTFYQDSTNKVRGIKVFDKNDKAFNQNKQISSFFSFEETTYLFVSDNSTNCKDNDQKGNPLLLEYAYSFLKISLK